MMTQLKLDTGGNRNGFRYLYTADDERLAIRNWKKEGTRADTSWFLRDLGGQVLREYRYLGTTKTWVRDYTYQNGLMLTVERPTGTVWPIVDHLGTPVVYQDSNHAGSVMGSFLFAYGEDQVNKDPNDIGSPKRFTAHERDQNLSTADLKDDLDYMHARYYSPHMGRFLSPDPVLDINLASGRPLGWNRYSYALSNPVRHVDLDGQVVTDLWDLYSYNESRKAWMQAWADFTANPSLSTGSSAFVALIGNSYDSFALLAAGVPAIAGIYSKSAFAVLQQGTAAIKDISKGTRTLDSLGASDRAKYATAFDQVASDLLHRKGDALARAEGHVLNRERARFLRGERATAPLSARQTAKEFQQDVATIEAQINFLNRAGRNGEGF